MNGTKMLHKLQAMASGPAANTTAVKVTADLQRGYLWENVTKCYVGHVVKKDIPLRDIL